LQSWEDGGGIIKGWGNEVTLSFCFDGDDDDDDDDGCRTSLSQYFNIYSLSIKRHVEGLMERALLLVNPIAGGGGKLDELNDLVAKQGQIDIQYIEQPGATYEQVQAALKEGYRTLVAAGGDGTLTEIVNSLAGRFEQVHLGIIPLGTANDLSKVLKIPSGLQDALAVVARGHLKARAACFFYRNRMPFKLIPRVKESVNVNEM
jgi:hypothetical protein